MYYAFLGECYHLGKYLVGYIELLYFNLCEACIFRDIECCYYNNLHLHRCSQNTNSAMNSLQLLAMDLSGPESMKNAAKCDTSNQRANLVKH